MAKDFSKAFYNSKEWKQTREYILKRDNYLCAHCGKPAEEVHHIIHLSPQNIGDVKVTMNPENLASLCKDCHFAEHYQDKGEGHRRKARNTEIDKEQFAFDEHGQLVRVCPPASDEG